MSATCYLCSGPATRVTAQQRAATTEGFGTCTNCSVHACPKHGDRAPDVFYCADCITTSAALDVIDPDQASQSTPNTQEMISRHGSYLLFARSPGMALTAARLFLPSDVPAMEHVLQLLQERPDDAVEGTRQA